MAPVILSLSAKECERTKASYGRKGKPNHSVQSQNTEGWAIETLLQSETIRDQLYRKILLTQLSMRLQNESGTSFCSAAWCKNVTPPTVEIKAPTVEIKTPPAKLAIDTPDGNM